MLILKDSAVENLTFRMDDQDGNAKTGLSPTVTISKNGAGYVTPAGAVSEVGSGLYMVAAHATDSNTLGSIDLLALDPAAIPLGFQNGGNGPWQVVSVNPRTDIAQTGDSFTRIGANGASLTSLATATALATVQSDTDDIQTRLPSALTANGNMKSSLVEILTTALTETAGLLAAGFKKFFNVATPTGTLNSLPAAIPGAAGGLLVDDVWTDARAVKLDNLDAAVSTRLATLGYTAPLDAAGTRTAVGLASANLDTQLGTIDDFIDTEIADIQARLPAALVAGKMDSHVADIAAGAITETSIAADAITAGKIATDAIDADALKADAITEIQSGLAGSTALATLQTEITEMHGLLGLYSGVRDSVYSGANLTSYNVYIYDSSAHALTNDGSTGVIHEYSVVNTYSGANLATSIMTKVS